LEERDSFEIVM